MTKKHYEIDGRVNQVWKELLEKKESLRVERKEAIQELTKQIIFDEVLGEVNENGLSAAKLHMEDINRRACKLEIVMRYIESGDYKQIENLLNEYMEEFDEGFVFSDEF